jgi:hypothetical protein
MGSNPLGFLVTMWQPLGRAILASRFFGDHGLKQAGRFVSPRRFDSLD